MENRELLDHVIMVQTEYEELLDKIPTEEKMVRAQEEALIGLEPFEIQEIAQDALRNLPDGLEEHVDALFDVIYEAVSEAVDKARR